MRKIFMAMAVVLLSAAVCTSCKKKSDPEPTPTPEVKAYDYSDNANWMVKADTAKFDVDVFYIYPTITEKGNYPAATLDSAELKSAYNTYLCQAGCLAECANMYVPYYHQATFAYAVSFGTADSLVEGLRKCLGKEEIFSALDYYFEHLNNDRPFILASHSQGSALMRLVFDEYMQEQAHKAYLNRMVAAYALGYSYPKKWMERIGLKGAEREDDCGVVITWNTEGPNATQASLLVSDDDYVINPLTWTTDTTYASALLNKGCLVWDNPATSQYHISQGVADAQVNPNRAALVCTTLTNYITGVPAFGDKSLHTEDWSAFYVNIRENAKVRIDAYFSRD